SPWAKSANGFRPRWARCTCAESCAPRPRRSEPVPDRIDTLRLSAHRPRCAGPVARGQATQRTFLPQFAPALAWAGPRSRRRVPQRAQHLGVVDLREVAVAGADGTEVVRRVQAQHF